IPGDSDAWAKQLGWVVLQQRRPYVGGTGGGVADENPAGVRDVLGSPSIPLVPTVRKFLPNPHPERKTGTQLDDVLNIPGGLRRSPVHERTIGNTHPVRRDSLQESKQAPEIRLSIVSSRRVRIDLNALKPASKT